MSDHFLRKLRKALALTSMIVSLSSYGGWRSYTVKKGDQLGFLIQKIGFKQYIWGDDGLLKKIYSNENPNFIVVGQVIRLPENLTDLEKLERFITKKKKDYPNYVQPRKVAKDQNGIEIERDALISFGTIFSLWDRGLKDKTSGANGDAKSNVIYGFFLEHHLPISMNWDIDSYLSFKHITFADSIKRPFIVNSKNFLKLSLGGARRYSNFRFGGGVVYEQMPIVTGVSSTEIGISSFNIVSPYVKGSWDFFQWQRSKLKLNMEMLKHLSSTKDSFELESGWAIS